MAKIITPGRASASSTPWYLQATHDCLSCGCLFQLDEHDFAKKDLGEHAHPKDADWRIVATARTPGGEQIIEGACPFCHETVRITGRNGTSLIGGTLGIGLTRMGANPLFLNSPQEE